MLYETLAYPWELLLFDVFGSWTKTKLEPILISYRAGIERRLHSFKSVVLTSPAAGNQPQFLDRFQAPCFGLLFL